MNEKEYHELIHALVERVHNSIRDFILDGLDSKAFSKDDARNIVGNALTKNMAEWIIYGSKSTDYDGLLSLVASNIQQYLNKAKEYEKSIKH